MKLKTLILVTLGYLAVVAVVTGIGVYVIAHFIAKFW